MYDRARRWAKASELDRTRRLAALETMVENAISMMETQQITRPSPVIADQLAIWREQLREAPARRAG